ncbi:MAG: SDR family oxidoreductase [Candidatus Nealsonbacteria bacterium]|nr:SDR family oxidoreductase [Candidatus Nealsonbacteria bacterium]
MFDLKGKVALVTGAGRGMGKSHSILLAQSGAKVAVTDINEKECRQVADEIKKKGGEAVSFKMDVSQKSEIENVIKETIKRFSSLDILVNNAGIFSPKSALDITEEEWDRTININLRGEFLCAQIAAKEMAKNKWGRIINISSIASGGTGIGFEGAAHYSASKGGIIGMTETLAVELAPLGITVNAVSPGAIETPMIGPVSEELKEEIRLRVPLQRIGKPEEVSALVVFLASKEASYITGATFYIDGGWLAK